MQLLLIIWFINLFFQLSFAKIKYSLLEIVKQGFIIWSLIALTRYFDLNSGLVLAYSFSMTAIILLTRYTENNHHIKNWIGRFTHLVHFFGLGVLWYQFGFLFLLKIVGLVVVSALFLSSTFFKIAIVPEELGIKEKNQEKVRLSLLSFCGLLPKVTAVYLVWVLFFA